MSLFFSLKRPYLKEMWQLKGIKFVSKILSVTWQTLLVLTRNGTQSYICLISFPSSLDCQFFPIFHGKNLSSLLLCLLFDLSIILCCPDFILALSALGHSIWDLLMAPSAAAAGRVWFTFHKTPPWDPQGKTVVTVIVRRYLAFFHYQSLLSVVEWSFLDTWYRWMSLLGPTENALVCYQVSQF